MKQSEKDFVNWVAENPHTAERVAATWALNEIMALRRRIKRLQNNVVRALAFQRGLAKGRDEQLEG